MDGQDGYAYLIINNSQESTTVELPKEASVYVLEGKTGLRSRVMTLNGRDLVLGENDELPCLCGKTVDPNSLSWTNRKYKTQFLE